MTFPTQVRVQKPAPRPNSTSPHYVPWSGAHPFQAEDLNLDNFERVDLTGCGLPTIPIIFHRSASSIVHLNLSRNPMVEIPLDFMQSCTILRELRLSNMAMKKVPQSVRHSASLHRLDLSCNRIVDLDDAALDCIPELSILKLQNNRMELLPWYFPRLRRLKALNISNDKFSKFPLVICEMPALLELDISFNLITELPEDIGKLTALEQDAIARGTTMRRQRKRQDDVTTTTRQ